jgi:outer membrane receptor for ferrienterochelin and colicins
MKLRKLAILFGVLIVSANLIGQDVSIDSTKIDALAEVVVTAQFEPQSLKKSVHNITVITKEQMQRQAANHLGDVLNQYLNMTVTPNAGTGRSTVSLFGLDGQYFKVMMDNIPLVSDTGLGNNVDLTQINLDDVEQIEIIEGSMGVTHGANAVSGIINIITKKSSKHDWEITATIQEETVGNEYNIPNEGRHIQSLKVSHKVNSKWFVSLGANRNDFQGFQGDRKGAFHTQNDGTRGYLWLPKSQWVTNSMVSFTENNFRAFYKFEFFDEKIDFYNTVVNQEFIPDLGIVRFSNDRRFLTQKFYHHLNLSGKFSEMSYNVSLSHQKQSRDFEDFKFYMVSEEEQNKERETFQSQEII